MEWIIWAKYIGAALAIGLSTLGCGLSEGLIAGKTSESIARQPKASGEIVQSMLVTQAVSETAGIFGLLIAFILFFVVSSEGEPSLVAAYMSAGFCMGAGSIGAGFGAGLAGISASESIARQPLQSTTLLLNTLIGQAISQTGAIFALVIALLLCINAPHSHNIAVIGALIGAGASMGIGAIGAGGGAGYITARAVEGISRNPKAGNILLRTMLLGQSVQQAKAIYSLIIAFLLLILVQGK